MTQVELARAGCPSTCKGNLGDVVIEPALACATVEATLETCDCDVFVEVINDCSGSLAIRGDGLDCAAGDDCFALPPGERGSFELQIRAKGSQHWSLPLDEAESGSHTLDISASVSELDSEPGCSLARVGQGKGRAAALAALSSLLLALRFRRRRA